MEFLPVEFVGTCPICLVGGLKPLSTSNISCKECMKIFHLPCISRWLCLFDKGTCPHCRSLMSRKIKLARRKGSVLVKLENREEERLESGRLRYIFHLNKENKVIGGLYFTRKYDYGLKIILKKPVSTQHIRRYGFHILL